MFLRHLVNKVIHYFCSHPGWLFSFQDNIKYIRRLLRLLHLCTRISYVEDNLINLSI